MTKTKLILGALIIVSVGTSACAKPRAFWEDVEFLRKRTDVVMLKNDEQHVAVVPQYQGHVMTSTTAVESGPSYGCLNYKIIEGELLSEEEAEGSLKAHNLVIGGEERFWLGLFSAEFNCFGLTVDLFVKSPLLFAKMYIRMASNVL